MRILYFNNPLTLKNPKNYEVKEQITLAEWLKQANINIDEHIIINKEGYVVQDLNKKYDLIAISPFLGKGHKGKNVFQVILGVALIAATGGFAAAAFGGGAAGLAMAHTVGAGLLLSGGGALIMGKMKMPTMDKITTEDVKQGYQWNVGTLKRSKGIKGITFGSNVVPQGELLAYSTFGSAASETDSSYIRTASPNFQAAASNLEIGTSKSYLQMLIGCGEGLLDSITNIKVNNVPIGEIEGAIFDIRLGSNEQQPLPYNNISNLIDYQAINQEVPLPESGTSEFIISTAQACSYAILEFHAACWFWQNLSDGTKHPLPLDIEVYFREQGTSTWYSGTFLVGTPINAIKSLSPFSFSARIGLMTATKYIYEIKVVNKTLSKINENGLITDNPHTWDYVPDNAAVHVNFNSISMYSAIAYKHPNTALLYLQIPASHAINGNLPNVTWKQTRSKINTKNPATNAYEQRPANNLAWAIYYLFCQIHKDENNVYHTIGENPENMDYQRFLAFADFCESIKAKGNWFLNQTRPAWEHAQDLATSCRAFIAVRNGKIAPFWDSAQPMTQIFTSGNILAGTLGGGYLSRKDRATAIEATFNNQENEYKTETIKIGTDDDTGHEVAKITFAGLTTIESVWSQARYILNRNKYLQQTVTFQAAIDSIVCELGDVIGVQSDVAQWGAGGRLVLGSANLAQLDTPVTLEAGRNYSLLVRHENGTLERKTPDETVGTFEILHFNNNPFSTPLQKNDVYSFGILNIEVKPFRVESIIRNDDLTATIEGIEYDARVYGWLPAPTISYTRASVGLNSVYTQADSEAGTINIGWESNSAAGVQVFLNDKFIASTEKNNITLPALNEAYDVKLVPYDAQGNVYSDSAQTSSVTVNYPAPSAPPVPVLQITNLGCIAVFYPVPQQENISYLIIKSNNTEIARTIIAGNIATLGFNLPQSGVQTITANFVNVWGKQSADTLFSVTPSGIGTDNIRDGAIVTAKLAAGAVTANEIAAGTITGDKIAAGTITGEQIAAGTLTADDIAAGSITSEKLAAGAVTAEKIESGTITGEQIAAGTITGAQIAAGTLTADDIAAGSITSEKLAAGAVTAEKLAANAVVVKNIRSDNYTSDISGFDINGESGNAEFNDVKVRGTIKGSVFELDEVSVIGSQMLVRSGATANSNTLGTNNQRVYVDKNLPFVVGDIVRIKQDLTHDYWGEVTGKGTDTVGLYIDLIDKHGTPFEISAGQAIVNYGKSGAGGLLLDGNAPKIDAYTHNGTPWNGLDHHVRLGNLNGSLDYTSDKYGIVIGDNQQHLAYDKEQGLRIKGTVEITSGDTYNAIQAAQQAANSAASTANAAQNTADTSLNRSEYSLMLAGAKLRPDGLDPTFIKGTNNIVMYNNQHNSSNPAVTVSRIEKPSEIYAPTSSSNFIIELRGGNLGAPSRPGLGGFSTLIRGKQNSKWIQRFIAKVPVGYSLGLAQNSLGGGGKHIWLSDNQGTGKWQEYVNLTQWGQGNISSSGFVFLEGAQPTTWYIAALWEYELTDTSEVEPKIADWTYPNKTTINGGKIETNSITANQIAANAIKADKIATDAIKSRNYNAGTGNFATAGTFLNLQDGTVRSKYFSLTANNAFFKGHIEAASGTIAGFTINANGLNNTITEASETRTTQIYHDASGLECRTNTTDLNNRVGAWLRFGEVGNWHFQKYNVANNYYKEWNLKLNSAHSVEWEYNDSQLNWQYPLKTVVSQDLYNNNGHLILSIFGGSLGTNSVSATILDTKNTNDKTITVRKLIIGDYNLGDTKRLIIYPDKFEFCEKKNDTTEEMHWYYRGNFDTQWGQGTRPI